MANAFYIPKYSDNTDSEQSGGKSSKGGFFVPSYEKYSFKPAVDEEKERVKKEEDEKKKKEEEQRQKAQNTIEDVANNVGGFLGAVGAGIAAPFQRVGEGTAEVINELTGGAEAERQANLKAEQDSIALIKELGSKLKTAKTDEEKNRYREAIRRVSGISDEQFKSIQDRQNQIIERVDPIKGAAAVGELGLNVVTGGTVGAAIKGGKAATKATSVAQKLITPSGVKQGTAAGATQGAAFGALGTAEQLGDDANLADYAQNIAIGAGAGGVIGGAIPAIGRMRNKTDVIGVDQKINDSAIKKVSSRVGNRIEALAEPVLQSSPALRTKELFTQAKTKFIRSEEPILQYLQRGEKQGLLDTSTSRRVETLMRDVKTSEQQAEYFMRNNDNWNNVITGLNNKGLKDMAKFAEARAELDLITRGVKPDAGRSAKFQQIIDAAPPEYNARYESMVKYYADLRERLVEGGIVSREQADIWAKQDPSYVHIQRELDNVSSNLKTQGRGGQATLKSSKTDLKRGESIAETKDLLQTAIGRTQQLEREILRNRAANALIDSLEQLNDGRILQKVESPDKIANRPTIAKRVNGAEETYVTLPEIEAAAKSWGQVPLGALGRALAAPTRLLRAGLTGVLNPAFVLKSAVRDPIESFTLSRNAMATHSPQNIIGSLADAAKKSELFDEFIRTEGSSTFTDVLRSPRNAARSLREQARLTKPPVERTAQIIKSPREWLRKIEDVNRVQEQLGRYQNFRGAYNDAIKRGATKESALIEARWAARNNMVDFWQTGDWSKIANTMLPYFNPAVQGGARIARSFKEKPVATSAKIVATIQIPTVMATMYNLSDPRRAEIYMDIPEYERQNNWIFVMPNSKKVDGRWEVIKIPKPAGVGNFSRPVETMTASMYGHDPAKFGDFVQAVISAGSPFDTSSSSGFVGSLIPQQLKPFIQDAANYDFFTGKQIVPDWLSESEPDPFSQHFDNTSQTAKEIAGFLGISPLRVEKFIKSSLGEGGQNAMFGIDSAIAAAGGDGTIGGRSPVQSATRSFTSATGGVNQTKLKEEFSKALDERSSISSQITEALKANDIQGANLLANEFNERLARIGLSADGEMTSLTDNQKEILTKLRFPLKDGSLSSSSIKSRTRKD